MRTLIVGDTHGDTENLKAIFRLAFERNCQKIIIVGDFGYFPNDEDGIKFLSFLDFMVRDFGIELAFVDGNHDDHYSLREHFEKRTSDVIIFSHDCPLGIEFGFKNDSETEANRKMLTEICEVVKPKILIHGHYHRFHKSVLEMSFGKVLCIGLDCNKNQSAQCLVLNDGEIE